MRPTELEGRVFGRLTCGQRYGTYYLCVCACGKQVKVRTDRLTSGKTQSCGCLREELNARSRAEALARRPPAQKSAPRNADERRLVAVWNAMVTRCYNPNDKGYAYYGGVGVIVCDEWRNSVEKFILWAKSSGYSRGLWLERKQGELGYTPSNCTWASPKAQSLNRRNTLYLMRADGTTVPMAVHIRRMNAARKGGKVKYSVAYAVYTQLRDANYPENVPIDVFVGALNAKLKPQAQIPLDDVQTILATAFS